MKPPPLHSHPQIKSESVAMQPNVCSVPGSGAGVVVGSQPTLMTPVSLKSTVARAL